MKGCPFLHKGNTNMKLLLHSCCAPCSVMCIESLRGEGHELSIFWYNPNIHPFTEYRSRRNCLTEYAKTIDLPVILKDEYALRPFVRAVAADIVNTLRLNFSNSTPDQIREGMAKLRKLFEAHI